MMYLLAVNPVVEHLLNAIAMPFLRAKNCNRDTGGQRKD